VKTRVVFVLLLFVGIGWARLGTARQQSPNWQPTCAAVSTVPLQWVRTGPMKDRPQLDRWCAGVGLPARIEGKRAAENFTGSFAVVTWNTHIGGGDIGALIADLRSGQLTGKPVTDFVLLIQEAYREGGDVPTLGGVAWAAAQKVVGVHQQRVEVLRAAEQLGLWAVYVPSMRNGEPGATLEDRGNAIISTRPLSDLTAIELPLERQRRVAVAATVAFDGPGTTHRVRIVCTHFTNMVMHHAWILSESGRLRQARALTHHLPTEGPLIVGGDFNSWFGFRDAAYKELAGRMKGATVEDRRATFGPLRLDHILFRLPDGWRSETRRADSKYGSDHYPLAATVTAR
jgi:endonuclease/exonuclease/phosphatase family metal-dependent hydrolase